MSYEIKQALGTLRKEGLLPLARKCGQYFCDIIHGITFMLTKRRPISTPTEEVDYAWNVASGLIGPSQVRSELIHYTTVVAGRRPKTYVEIGTAKGGTLFLACRFCDPTALVISIDLPCGMHGGGYPLWRGLVYRRFAQPEQRIGLLRADSHASSTRQIVENLLSGRGIDLLFIDGDHTYEGVKRDFELYSKLVNPGGLIAFHDICKHSVEPTCEVDKFWAEIKVRYRHTEYVESASQGWGGIGLIYLPDRD